MKAEVTFMVADIREAQCMKKILNDYEKASGHAINYTKSEVYYSRNTPASIKESRNKKALFGYLKDRMWKKIQSWSGKHLSKAGRELAMRKEYGGMGFCHLYGFNLAMLGKQGWHLLTNQDTILSKLFKPKYYSKEGFLDAKLGHNPSYVWRSIQASQVVIRSELRWRVGNGANIDVWRQPWLRNSDNSCVTYYCD
ncbi:ribonuclease H, partial [Trifolium pratense]